MTPSPILSGIDVSHYQGTVDWSQVAQGGIHFAYAKCCDGLHPDPQFASNWSSLASTAISRGAYHFFRPAIDAGQQADEFLKLLTGFRPGDLPPMLDLEEAGSPDQWAAIPAAERTGLALEWLEQVGQTLSVTPVVYTRAGWVDQTLGGQPGDLVNYPLWIAHYTSAPSPALPPGWGSWSFWQYSETGSVAGIHGHVDLDRFQGSPEDLAALALVEF